MSAISNKITYQIVGDDKQLMQDLDKAEKGIESRSGGFMSSAKKIGAAIGGALATKQIVEWGASFETSMAAASTLFGDVQVNADGLQKDMLALSDSTGIAADQLGNSLYNALSAGVPASEDMGEALAFLESSAKLAKAGFTDIDTAQSATIKTMNAYGASMEDAEKYQKILIQTQNKGIATVGELGGVLAQVTPTAAQMNVSFEQVGAALATMTAKGTPAAQATTQLNALIAELGKEGTTASNHFKKFTSHIKEGGLSFTEAMEMGWDLNDVLSLFQEEADASDKSMLDFFSSLEAGKAAASVFGEGFTDALGAMSTEVDVVGEAFDKVSNTSAEQFNIVMNQLKNIAIELFLALAPFITEILPILGELLGIIIPPLVEIAKNILEPLVGILMSFLGPLSAIVEFLMPLFVAVLGAILDPIKQFLDDLKALIDFLVGYFTENWEEIWNSIKEFFFVLWDNISAFITDTWTSIKNTAVSIFNALSSFFSGIWSGISGIFNTYIEMIKGYFKGLWSGISQVVEGIKRVFSGLIDFFTGVFTGNWRQALNGIKDIFGGAFDALVGIAKAPINAVVGLINGFIGGLNKIKIPSWVPGVGGKGINIPKLNYLKVGLQYVPDDDFPAMLHEGEAVLTKAQADRWRKGLPRFESYHQYDFAGSNNITLKNEMVGIVEMDGYNVGKIVLRNIDEVREMG